VFRQQLDIITKAIELLSHYISQETYVDLVLKFDLVFFCLLRLLTSVFPGSSSGIVEKLGFSTRSELNFHYARAMSP
jgi:hypothetical protein